MVWLKFCVVLLYWAVAVILLSLHCHWSHLSSYLHFHLSQLSLDSSLPSTTYSYIVVGAGSAGSVVAGRLASLGHSVLLLEAGGKAPWLASVPAVVGTLQLGAMDWQYRTVTQTRAGLAGEGGMRWPRGKVLGGTSVLNYMLYVRGHRRDYEEWEEDGLEGWGWDSVLQTFKKSENWLGDYEGDEKYHGVGGPLHVSPVPHVDPITWAFLEGGKQMGYKVGDINGDEQDSGFTISQTTTINGKRQDTFKSFAEPFVGENLRVLEHSHVTRILVEDGVAVGVEVTRHGVTRVYKCSKEVILSAGAIGTPHLLLLSGIGDKDHLASVGVPVVLHLPEVGNNLQDHLAVFLNMDVGEGLAFNPVLEPVSSVLEYLLHGEGPFSHAGVDAMAQVRTNLSRDSRPDIQLVLASISVATDMGLTVKKNLGMSKEAWGYHEPGVGKDTASILTILSRPLSRGSIRLQSSDPLVHPYIDPNYLSREEDLNTLVAGLKVAKQLLETDALKAAGAREWSHARDPYCAEEVYDTEEYWECYVKHWSLSIYHPVSTAAMGTVTDSRLRVKGLRGLRVADASVMPNIVGGNTNAAAIMIGEKAAEFILEENGHVEEEVNDHVIEEDNEHVVDEDKTVVQSDQDVADFIIEDVAVKSIDSTSDVFVNKEEL